MEQPSVDNFARLELNCYFGHPDAGAASFFDQRLSTETARAEVIAKVKSASAPGAKCIHILQLLQPTAPFPATSSSVKQIWVMNRRIG